MGSKKLIFKVLGLVFICLTLMNVCASCSKFGNKNHLLGEWKGETESAKMVLIFKKDMSFQFIVERKIDSDKQEINGNYQIDFEKTPIPITLRKIDDLNHPLHSIVQFKDRDTIIISKFSKKAKLRPITFNKNSDLIFYKKK